MSSESIIRRDLGPGSFRSRSRFWVDRNPRSRENLMRDSLEKLLGHSFPKARPSFLRNPATNRCLELDAWCETLKIGAEFAGEQHRVFPNSCHSTREEFEKQQARDQLKMDLCKKHEVILLVVPDSVTSEQMHDYVKTSLCKLGVDVPLQDTPAQVENTIPSVSRSLLAIVNETQSPVTQ